MRTSRSDQPVHRRMEVTMTDTNQLPIDLVVDLNGEDESGLPWTFIDEARDRSLVAEGAWLIVGQGDVQAVAQVIEIEGEIVRVRPLPGPVDRHRHLLAHHVA
jgi:hypothetical protein